MFPFCDSALAPRRITMENNRRVVLSLALVAIIAVAAIGIGYAYTASVSNTGNNSDVDYLTIKSLTDDGSDEGTDLDNAYSQNFSKNIALDTTTTLDTSDDEVKIEYKLAEGTTKLVGSINYTAAGYVYLVIDQQKSSSEQYALTVLGVAGTGEGDVFNTNDFAYVWEFIVVSSDNQLTDPSVFDGETPEYVNYDTTAGSRITITDSKNYTFVKATLLVALKNSEGPVNTITTDYEHPLDKKAMQNVTFTFKATTNYVIVTLGSNMTRDTTSGELVQNIVPNAGTPISIIKVIAASGKTFANTYMGAVDGTKVFNNGITITIDSSGDFITISGVPNTFVNLQLTSLE